MNSFFLNFSFLKLQSIYYGIDPELEDKLDQMFLCVFAIGDHAWTPNQGINNENATADSENIDIGIFGWHLRSGGKPLRLRYAFNTAIIGVDSAAAGEEGEVGTVEVAKCGCSATGRSRKMCRSPGSFVWPLVLTTPGRDRRATVQNIRDMIAKQSRMRDFSRDLRDMADTRQT
ncbi:hypothetical protein M5K25_010791 [Dendrobium thyrsiflorum]|uniref:Uncharacterized protein n=1 Tax=Dendrobium thyrsiflorum TaxID=117978 RepID=A0ABD0V119_DENTH